MKKAHYDPNDPRRGEIHDLAKRLYACKGPNTPTGECRRGVLGVFDTDMGITVRLFLHKNSSHVLVYSYLKTYTCEKGTHGRIRVISRSKPAYAVGTFDADYADLTLELLYKELILESLAEL